VGTRQRGSGAKEEDEAAAVGDRPSAEGLNSELDKVGLSRSRYKSPDGKLQSAAHPSRVISQAVFQKFAAGHPKFRAEREARS
jgi:hypothetical protein